MPEENAVANKKSDNTNLVSEISGKINEAQNILIALSSDPSVDEMSAAIGLSLFLDKLGKRATAIYSGTTPNALEFLKPEETFEPTIDALQDFVIALSKEKADHLRYKLDGDFVKIYITPYKTRIAEEDLDYSYGDFNVDLVLAFDVANGVDLDSALREHGRIMHDAVIINVTTGNPGKLGEIEWSDKNASSVSEMIAELIYSMDGDVKMGKEEATAFLTGIVAATDRFSKANTTPEAMRIASRLMESGADQQLVSKNITSDIQNELLSFGSSKENEKTVAPVEPVAEVPIEAPSETPQEVSKDIEEDSGETLKIPQDEPDLLDDLKAAEASLANNSAETIPEPAPEPVKLEEEPVAAEPEPVPEPVQEEPTPAVEPEPVAEPEPTPEPTPTMEPTAEPAPDTTGFVSDKPEKVIQPSESMNEPLMAGSNKYGQMLEDALTSIDDPMAQAQPQVVAPPTVNPAMVNAPAVPTAPEINGVPSMNYAPLPSDQVLPPPPAPPVDPNAAMPTAPAVQPTMQPVVESAPQPTPQPVMQPVMPTVQPITPAAPPVAPTPDSLGPQPAMQDQVYGPQASDPGAFKIPGM